MLIGVDAGATSTRAVVLDHTGRCLGTGKAGGGNPIALGPARAGRGIRDAVAQAVHMARATDPDHPEWDPGGALRGRAVLAMAGSNAFVAPEAMAGLISEVLPVGRVEVASDILAMFASGTAAENGYVLVAGTGAAALRVEDSEVAATADGLGWLLGDFGSGFWIGHRAVRAGLAALCGYGPPTALGEMLREEAGLPQGESRVPRGRPAALEAAVEIFYRMEPVELSRYASLVFQAARVADPGDSGQPVDALFRPDADPVAVDILTSAVARLSATLRAVRSPEVTGPVIIGGSVAKRLPGLTEAVAASFSDDGMARPEIRIVADGVIGAGMLALRSAGVPVDETILSRVRASFADLPR